MTEHPNVELTRRGYDAFAAGDLAALSELLAGDVTWHVRGVGPLSGDYHGRDEVFAFFGRLAEETAGTFRLDVHDVLANDEHTVALCTLSASRGTKSVETPVAQRQPCPRRQGHRVLGRNYRPAGEYRLLVLSRQPGHLRPPPGSRPAASATPGQEHRTPAQHCAAAAEREAQFRRTGALTAVRSVWSRARRAWKALVSRSSGSRGCAICGGWPRCVDAAVWWLVPRCVLGAGSSECPGGEFGSVCQLQFRQDASHMSLNGPFGEHQLGGDRAVGDPGRDQVRYLPLARGQRVAGSDGLFQVVDEMAGAVGWAGHVEAARLRGCLPGERPGLRLVAAGGARSQRAGPVEPGEGDQGPGSEPGVDRHGGGEAASSTGPRRSGLARGP